MITALRLTKLTNNKGALTKRYALAPDGGLTKTTTAALYDGRADLLTCDTLADFLVLRAALKPNEALMFGLTGRQSVGITTKSG